MKSLRISILIATLVGLSFEANGKSAKTAQSKTATQELGSYAELENQYNTLAKSFEALEVERAKFVAKNPSLDELAESKLDERIAKLRRKADELYAEMGEFPQFSASHAKPIPKSPKYMPSDKDYKACMVKSKAINKDVKKLTKSVSNQKK